jgi:UDP-glucose 4-epimerase
VYPASSRGRSAVSSSRAREELFGVYAVEERAELVTEGLLRTQSALVTGGGGFIGTRLCRRLAQEGTDVHAVGRNHASHLEGIARTWAVDVSREQSVRELIAAIRPEIVFHLASAVVGSRELAQVWPTFENNLASTVNLLIAATEAGCKRIVLTGSMEEPRPDNPDPRPPSPYAAAKWASTVYARMFHSLYDAPVVALRVFMVYGPGQQDGTKLIPYVGRCFLDGVAPKLASGRRLVDWVYVDDVVEACMRVLDAPEALGKTMDVGSGMRMSIREVVERLARLTAASVRPLYGALPDRPLESDPVADVDRTYEVLGWRAMTDLDAGLRSTVDWLRNREVDSRTSGGWGKTP